MQHRKRRNGGVQNIMFCVVFAIMPGESRAAPNGGYLRCVPGKGPITQR